MPEVQITCPDTFEEQCLERGLVSRGGRNRCRPRRLSGKGSVCLLVGLAGEAAADVGQRTEPSVRHECSPEHAARLSARSARHLRCCVCDV